jgi:hypothetical protein
MKECQGMAVGVKLSFQSKNGQGKKGQGKNGAAVRTRTGDLYFTKVLLYQLSYSGTENQSTLPSRPVRVLKIIETSLRPLLKGKTMLKKSLVIFKGSNPIFSLCHPNPRFTKA